MTKPLAVYLHWPFCKSKCPYCDFNVHVREQYDIPRWKSCYEAALRHYHAQTKDHDVVSIFFGGGTPSLMPPELIAHVIGVVKELWQASSAIEITMEANPTSVERAKFEAFREAGVNRVSLGVQSLEDEQLKFLGRTHSAAEALEAINTAQDIFPRMSFDLIYARPEQTLGAWEDELKRAIDLGTSHLSLYQLTIERNTPFYYDVEQGKFSVPDEDSGAELYELTARITDEAGLPAYEVSNYARAGEESRHNMIYWRYQDYIGVGPGAHGRYRFQGRKLATREHQAPDIWLERTEANGTAAHEPEVIAPRDQCREALMMGLRLREGVDMSTIAQRTGVHPDEILDPVHLAQAVQSGWIVQKGKKMHASVQGWLRLNALLPYIWSDDAK